MSRINMRPAAFVAPDAKSSCQGRRCYQGWRIYANPRAMVVLIVLAALTGCEERKRVEPPVAKPNPEATYDKTILLEVKGNVSNIRSVSGYANYAISNEKKCVPLDYTRAIGGTRPYIYESTPVEIKEGAGGGYHIHYKSSPYLDEDYYGMGKCKWVFTGVSLVLNRPVGAQKLGASQKSMGAGRVERYCFVANSDTCVGRAALPVDGSRKTFVATLQRID